jgi:hypothetical protein
MELRENAIVFYKQGAPAELNKAILMPESELIF